MKFETSEIQKPLHARILLYGPGKIGKTWLCIHAPIQTEDGVTLIVDTEGFTDYYFGREDIPHFIAAQTRDIYEIIELMKQLKESPYIEVPSADGSVRRYRVENLAIDSISPLWDARLDAGAEKMRLRLLAQGQDPAKAKTSRFDYGWVKAPVQDIYDLAMTMPCNVIITARQRILMREEGHGFVLEGYKAATEKSYEFALPLVLRTDRPRDDKGNAIESRRGERTTYIERSVYETKSLQEGRSFQGGITWEDLAPILATDITAVPVTTLPTMGEVVKFTVNSASWCDDPKKVAGARSKIIKGDLSEKEVNVALRHVWYRSHLPQQEMSQILGDMIAWKTEHGNLDDFILEDESPQADDIAEGEVE